MREIRIYQPGDYAPGQTLELSPSAGQHVGIVLRRQVDETITLFRGDNYEFEAVITAVHKKKVVVNILNQRLVNRESPRSIHLAQAISKGERMEIVIQKAVELGVSSITPLLSERSVVRLDEERMEKKLAQWQAIAIAACEQCGRNQVPKIEASLYLNDYLQRHLHALKFVLHPDMGKSWRDYQILTDNIALLIGPEGGFSAQEIEQILSYNFNPLSLGPRVLRTETAAIAALSVLQAICGDL
ncbi:16S rRNA (uracil(1498)-N(3))-methyltransferase [Legionella jamestowniensis]|uniref:Ribosomal RNA small subunit methyltransferase E n=1 Tax=Legionella jamestowniensis TaxID=455 RepID=A0A0W0UIF5_9GAMM|nr:16S rRNA (uracil(1498)-N(3))-methyltransferase [Legionella jamestowniensis]KTD07664.1 16S ribosomal RNA methyltransferase RsmE [Legionella jamestowniensis]OCH99407.1 16S rRNA (uracil(1498)-N(3))-methyltransferase [Legionella jamestowniensis]SFL60318.1 16S rRNA m(3)U-1498 methyltransferase [Legionella jamestowniensis DSM 19215]